MARQLLNYRSNRTVQDRFIAVIVINLEVLAAMIVVVDQEILLQDQWFKATGNAQDAVLQLLNYHSNRMVPDRFIAVIATDPAEGNTFYRN